MFHVKTELKESKIHGIGLFAGENIDKGQKIYTKNSDLELSLTPKEFSKLQKNEQKTIKHYGCFDKKVDRWHLDFDDIRFCNHSKNGNITLKEESLVASRNIEEGKEITQDYSQFEEPLRGGLKKQD